MTGLRGVLSAVGRRPPAGEDLGGVAELDLLAGYPLALWGQRRFLRLGVLTAGLEGRLAFG